MTAASTLTGLIDSNPAFGLQATGRKDAAKELNDRFLKLLVAQMSNQDPLNPLDNAQVTSQMAQINTVTGINGLNDTVTKLLEQFARLEAMQAAQLTGRSVLVEGSGLALAGDVPAAGAFELPAAAEAVVVQVRDANGVLVREIDLGPAREGIRRFAWDGRTDAGARAADGTYGFSVRAVANGRELTATALAVRTVEAVSSAGGSTRLALAGGGTVAYADVRQIL